MKTLAFQKKLVLFSFITIPILMLIFFVVYPTINLIHLSFTDWDGASPIKNFIGFDNFKTIFISSPEVWGSMKNNLIYLVAWALIMPVNILIAIFLNSIIKGNKFFKTITFMPYIINGVAISYMFSFFLSSQNGGLNGILSLVGLGGLSQNWLSNVHLVNYTLAAVSLWRGCGFHIIVLLTGLQAIPAEYFEAARVDGAKAHHLIIYIIVPGLKRIIEVLLFLNISGCLQVFDIPFIMTGGGPGYASSTFATYSIDQAFKFNSFGLASAMAVVLMVIIILLTVIQKKFLRIKG